VQGEFQQRLQAVRSGQSPTRPATAESGAGKTDLLGGLHVLAGPIDVDPTTAAQLSQILHDPKTYFFGFAKACTFNPDLAIRFEGNGGRSVVILFCFTCDELAIYDGSTGRHVGTEDDDTKRPQLVEIAKRLFPEDSYFKGLVPEKN
jgi:hypothetical protein